MSEVPLYRRFGLEEEAQVGWLHGYLGYKNPEPKNPLQVWDLLCSEIRTVGSWEGALSYERGTPVPTLLHDSKLTCSER